MSTSARDAMARGDFPGLIEALGTDESERFTVETPFGTVDAYVARIGSTVIALGGSGDMGVSVHDDDGSASEYYSETVATWQAKADQLRVAIASGPQAFMSFLASMAGQEDESPIPTSPAPAPAVGRAPVVYMAAEGEPGTGLYL